MGGTVQLDGEKERDKALDGLASLPYLERLSCFIRGSTKHWVAGGVSVLDFRPLFSVTIHHLQRQLAEAIQEIDKTDLSNERLCEIGNTVHRYTNALRDFEFIHSNRWNTYFVKDIAASRLDDGPGSRLQAALLSELNLQSHDLHRSLFRDSDLLGSFNPRLLQHSTTISQSLATGRAMTVEKEERRLHIHMMWRRFGFAVVGGLIIIVPMLILMNGIATVKSQAVISVSIFLFAGGVAVLSSSGPENLLVATAAYSAVLVTFFR
ncbi:hypothetical protein B0I35DRAFT_443385 [Stachybotrys elegans]|uniref:DUF6594 domain-containing protein n=1 Tax=Stachybotrys elegans TaxID=80388 RepID=A0A8K0SGI6_9HYPO|nr:hypothetical protein B0I35DRAFT_443385 [Stachybotrys elegans]